jgi:hypothetical protein
MKVDLDAWTVTAWTLYYYCLRRRRRRRRHHHHHHLFMPGHQSGE